MREISPCYNYMLKWFVFIGLLISFNLAESLVPSHYENEVTRSKRDIVDAKTIGNALYEPEEQDVIIRREEIPIPPFDSNVESNNKESLKNTDTQTGEVKSNIEQKQEHGSAATTASSDKKQQTKKTSAKKESLKKLVQTRADVLKKEEDENLLKGMDSNVDHPLIKSDLTKQYRESTELDHGEMMGIETERDDINEPITSDNSLLTKNKNYIKFNEIETDIVPKEHFFNTDNTENKRDNIITTNNVVTTPKKQDNLLLKENVPNLVVSPVVTSTTRPTFTVVKRSATLDNDLLPLSKFESEYALEGGGEMADGGPPSHFQVDDKSADLEINANSAGVKVKAKPASLQVVSKPGAHGAGPHPYILPVHHYEYLDDEFHDGHSYRRSSCCRHRHYHHGLRRCCRENPDQLCCHHRRRHRIPRHHRHHHHEDDDDDDDDDLEEQRHYIARHRHHHYHPRHVNFSPEEGRNDENAYRRHQIHRRRHHLNFAPQPYDEAGFYHHPIIRPSIDSEMNSPFPEPGRFSASFNPQQYGGFALPGSMSIPDRMMDMDGNRRDNMYNNYNQLPQFPQRPQYPGIPFDSPYFQRYSRTFHSKHKSHDVKGRTRSAVETAMDPRLGSVANANGFNSGIALPDEDAMYFGQFQPEAMDERERIHQNHLRKIQDSTYKQFADELAFKQQNIAMDSHSRFQQQQQPPLIPSASTATKQFHQFHNKNAAPLLSHSHEFHSIEDDENHDRGLSYHDSSSSRLTTRQHSDDNGGPPYHEYHHYNGGSSRHSRHRFSNVNPREKYHDHIRYFNEPSQLAPSSPSSSSSSITDEENREDAFEKAELSSHHSDDIEKSEEAARSSPDGGDEMEDGGYEKKRSFLHPRKR